MKKVLSMILALAMVLAMVPSVFAAETPEEKMVYDFGELYRVDPTIFTETNNADYKGETVYQNLLPHMVVANGAGDWEVYSEPWGNTDPELRTYPTHLSRTWYTISRSPDDSYSSKTIALSFCTDTANVNNNYGNGWHKYGVATEGVNIGYGFGSTAAGEIMPGGEKKATIAFTAPKAGIINPVMIVADGSAWAEPDANLGDGTLVQVYKVSAADGTVTPVYSGDVTSVSTATGGWIQIPSATYKRDANGEYVLSGGNKVVINGTLTLNYETVAVEAGDKIIAKFDMNGTYSNDEVFFPTYKMIYLGEDSLKTSYDMGEGFVSTDTFGTEVTDLATGYNGHLTPANANVAGARWQFGNFNASTNVFTNFTMLNRPYTNYLLDDDDAGVAQSLVIGGTTHYGKRLDRADPRDTVKIAAGYHPSLAWSGMPYPLNGNDYVDVGHYEGAIGYNFGSGKKEGNSTNKASNAQLGIRFVAPRAGVITPYIKMYAPDATGFLYTVYKVSAKDNSMVRIYPAYGKATFTPVRDTSNTHDSTTDLNSAWIKDAIWGSTAADKDTNGFVELTGGYARVSIGDEIIVRIDKKTPGWLNSRMLGFDTVLMNYDDSFGPDDEPFKIQPFASYEAEYKAYYGDVTNTIDLSIEVLNPEALGSMEYELTDPDGTLRATATPGIYQIVKPYTTTPATLTAGYFSPGTSSANGDAPRFTTSTTVKVTPLSESLPSLTMEPLKFTQLGIGYDAYLLPYYADAAERELYGTVDLGLADAWKNATVSFSMDGKFEYLGNGRVRALSEYNYTQAGGEIASADTTDIYNSPVNYAIPRARDKNTVGTPVVMTLTAADGGKKSFALWAFATTLDADRNQSYSIDYNAYNPNGVLAMEAYDNNNGTYVYETMYKESSQGTISPLADDPYATRYRAPLFNGDLNFALPETTIWNNYFGKPEYYKPFDGFSWRFTSPRDGRVEVSTYLPKPQEGVNNAGAFTRAGAITSRILLTKLDGTTVELFSCGYNSTTVAPVVLFQSRKDIVKNTELATFDDTNDTMTVTLKKGETLRVLLGGVGGDQNNEYFTLRGDSAPKPTFTFNSENGAESFEKVEGGFSATVYVPNGAVAPQADNLLIMTYDAQGKLMDAQTNDGSWLVMDMGNGETGCLITVGGLTGTPAYAKLFMWNDLGNIQPLSGDLVLY